MSQYKVPKSMENKYSEIMELIANFCSEYLNEEYTEVCAKLCAALSRKRPSPLIKGRNNTWACGIVHAIGVVNFLFDSTQVPHIKAGELYKKFGVSNKTGSSKSKEIQELMKITVFDPEWTLPSKIEDNPLVWMVSFNGMPIDIRYAPRDMQEMAFEQGIIPYIPADVEDKQSSEVEEKQEINYRDYDNVIPFKRPDKTDKIDDKERFDMAQGLMYEAWESINPEKRIELAKKALDLSKNCAEAYILLAQEEDVSDEGKKELYERALKAAENTIGEEDFEKYKGKFWSVLETRPYMRAKFHLADILWLMGKEKEAIKHSKEMLELNPSDNQGVRGILINWLIVDNDDKYVEKLLNKYKDDFLLGIIYSRALYLFKKKQIKKATGYLREAFERNPHVPEYLLGIKNLPDEMPSQVGFGDENEAIAYVYDSFEAWHSVNGAIRWLIENFEE